MFPYKLTHTRVNLVKKINIKLWIKNRYFILLAIKIETRIDLYECYYECIIYISVQ